MLKTQNAKITIEEIKAKQMREWREDEEKQ